jgi:predicted kinase
MSPNEATLHLFCGKIAAGKSTLAAGLGLASRTVIVSQDDWLARLYPDEMTTWADYVRCAPRLRDAMEPHLLELLRLGISIVLDFPANTPPTRLWMRRLIDNSGCAHQLHYLDVPDEVCRGRLHARNAAGTHDFTATDADFNLITSYFIAPTPEEGFNVVVHRP